MNSALDIYPEKEIEKIITFLTSERDIISVSETNGVSTVTVQSTLLLYDTDYTYLAEGHYVQINNINYKVLSVVDNISFDITATGLESETKWSLALGYRYGSGIEINELLNLAIQNPDEQLSRFPLLWFIIDAENSEENNVEYQIDFAMNCKFSMINLTEIEYKASQRLDNNFIPTLQPYVTLFLKALHSSYFSNIFLFEQPEIIDYRKYYRYFYGSADKSQMVLDSPTDAIEFDINLSFKKQYCNEDNPQGQGFGIGSMFIVS